MKLKRKNTQQKKTKKKVAKKKPSNSELLAESKRLIRKFILQCGKNKKRLAELTGLSVKTINRTLDRADCKDLRNIFNSLNRIDYNTENRLEKILRIEEAFDEFLERLSILVKYLSVKQNYSIYYKGQKHTCLLRSSDRPRSLTGKNLSDIIIDEFDRIPYYKQKQVWRECISRIRKTEFGTCAVVTTPDGYKMTYELWGKSSS